MISLGENGAKKGDAFLWGVTQGYMKTDAVSQEKSLTIRCFLFQHLQLSIEHPMGAPFWR